MSGIPIERDVPLAPLTTLGLGGPAQRYCKLDKAFLLSAALTSADEAGWPVLVLGGGSNLVVRDQGFAGLVIHMALTGTNVERSDDAALIWARAGIVWDDFVAATIDDGYAGLECLSGIPGLVGATPMQNVGAYGQEVSDTIVLVRAWDREARELVTFTRDQCAFAYRHSKFRGSARWIIVDVRFRLPKSELSMPIKYVELAKALGIAEGERAPTKRVRETVIALRRGKGMVVDPKDPDSRSAGSFFTNPIVPPSAVPALPNVPQWPQSDGNVKLSAAWLIERAGFAKGTTRGRVGISTKHALALVNRGGATAEELLAFAREIQDGVRAKFAIDLVPEPVIT